MEQFDYSKVVIVADNEKEKARITSLIKVQGLEEEAKVYTFSREVLDNNDARSNHSKIICFTCNAGISSIVTGQYGLRTCLYVPNDAEDIFTLRRELLQKGRGNRFFMDKDTAFLDILNSEVHAVMDIIGAIKDAGTQANIYSQMELVAQVAQQQIQSVTIKTPSAVTIDNPLQKIREAV